MKLYVWNLEDSVTNLIKFCKEKGINEVFITNLDTDILCSLNKAGIKPFFIYGTQFEKEDKNAFSFLKEVYQSFPFAGIHLDIELKSWKNFFPYRKFIKNLIKHLQQDNIPIDCDINPLMSWLLMLNCPITIMAYSNTIHGVINKVKLSYKNKYPFSVAVETQNIQPSNITFYGTSMPFFDLALQSIYNFFFHGDLDSIAVHYYKSYKELK